MLVVVEGSLRTFWKRRRSTGNRGLMRIGYGGVIRIPNGSTKKHQ